MNTQTPHSLALFNTAKANLGQVLSGNNAALGCAITVNNVALQAWGHEIGGGASTTDMYTCLQDHTKFTLVLLANILPGDIIISPTGLSSVNISNHGHVGVVAQYGILSNSSEDGKLHEQWTIPLWYDHYSKGLGFPVYFFRAI